MHKSGILQRKDIPGGGFISIVILINKQLSVCFNWLCWPDLESRAGGGRGIAVEMSGALTKVLPRRSECVKQAESDLYR